MSHQKTKQAEVALVPRENSSTAIGRWTANERELLDKRRNLAWSAQHAYFERASILTALNYLLGIPVVIVTVLAGSEIVAKYSENTPVPLWVGILAVGAAVLASLQTFFRLGEKAAFSSVAGNRYAAIRRRIEDLKARPPVGDRQKVLDEIGKRIDDAGEQSPPIGERRWLTWQDYAETNGPPAKRSWWRALLGWQDRDVRRRRKTAAANAASTPKKLRGGPARKRPSAGPTRSTGSRPAR
jgi:hypothetical protein